MSAGGANRLVEAAREIQDFCEARDADLNLFTGIGGEAAYTDPLLAHFGPRIDRAREFALEHRVLLLRAANGVPPDVSLGALEFEEQAVAGASFEEIVPGERLRLVSPGSLVVFKSFADRPQDWLDIEGVIVKSGARIDWPAVEAQLRVLLELKGDFGALERLAALRRQLAAR